MAACSNHLESFKNADAWVLDPRNFSLIGLEGGLGMGVLQLLPVTQMCNKEGGTAGLGDKLWSQINLASYSTSALDQLGV